jgi:acylphosphatase
MEHARRYLVRGLVQGVGFRFFAERTARRLRLSGYVMNRRDGSVEVYAIGSPDRLEELKSRLAVGPSSAHVSGVDEEEARPEERYRNAFTVEFEGGRW